MADDYGGVIGAFPYAMRRSDSWLFRSYVAVAALVAAVTTLIVAAGVVVLIAGTATVRGGTFTFSRSLYVVVGLFVVAPVVAPVLLVARRHRRGGAAAAAAAGTGADRYDLALGAAGYLFVLALYVGLVVTVPPAQQTPPTGVLAPLAPVVDVLYALPAAYGVVPPLVAAALIVAVHRLVR
jgi:hypothetical protein